MPRQSSSQTTKAKEAARLRALRKRLGLTLREMAKEFQVSHVAIGHWERGLRTIPGSVLRLLEIYEEEKFLSKRKQTE